MRRRSLLAAFAVAPVSAVIGGRGVLAAATQEVPVEISVIHATRTDGGASMDPRLRDLPQLTRQQPFVRYNVFKLLDRTQLRIEKGKRLDYGILDGRTLQVTLVDVTEDDAGQRQGVRYQVRAEIGGPGKREFLKLLEVSAGANEPFFVGGQSYRGGTLFLELAVR